MWQDFKKKVLDEIVIANRTKENGEKLAEFSKKIGLDVQYQFTIKEMECVRFKL